MRKDAGDLGLRRSHQFAWLGIGTNNAEQAKQ